MHCHVQDLKNKRKVKSNKHTKHCIKLSLNIMFGISWLGNSHLKSYTRGPLCHTAFDSFTLGHGGCLFILFDSYTQCVTGMKQESIWTLYEAYICTTTMQRLREYMYAKGKTDVCYPKDIPVLLIHLSFVRSSSRIHSTTSTVPLAVHHGRQWLKVTSYKIGLSNHTCFDCRTMSLNPLIINAKNI